MKKINLIIIYFLLINFFTNELYAGGKITGFSKVIDGDTIIIKKIKIRFHGIDAPEMNQICNNKDSEVYFCGKVAKKALKKFIGFSKVICFYNEFDRYKRAIGTCYLLINEKKKNKYSKFLPNSSRYGQSLNSLMVTNGHAVAYKKYSKIYLNDENWAKNNKLGMWEGNFDTPEKWRRKYK